MRENRPVRLFGNENKTYLDCVLCEDAPICAALKIESFHISDTKTSHRQIDGKSLVLSPIRMPFCASHTPLYPLYRLHQRAAMPFLISAVNETLNYIGVRMRQTNVSVIKRLIYFRKVGNIFFFNIFFYIFKHIHSQKYFYNTNTNKKCI